MHLGYRLWVRLLQLFPLYGAAGPGSSGWWRTALVGFAALDIAVWAVLRRSARFGLWWRLPLDALDIALWSLAPNPPTYDTAALVAFPLGMEAGVRRGLAAAALAPAALAVVAPIRMAAGVPVRPFTLAWLWLAAAMGFAMRRYCDRVARRAELDMARSVAAEAGRADLAGQHAVAMGASSVVDAIEGLVPLLGPPAAGSALDSLAGGWKAQLGEATTSSATYLQVALLRWERRHNHHPDLAGMVSVRVAEGAGTTLLTPGQEPALGAVLDGLALAGPVHVKVTDPDPASRQPGTPLRLAVGGHGVVVPADPGGRTRPVDPAPMLFVFAAILSGRDVLPAAGGVPAWAVATVMGALLGAAVWAHRRLRDRSGIHGRILVVAGVLTVGCAGLSGATLAYPVDISSGANVYPVSGAVYALSLLVGLYRGELTRRAWLFAVASFAAAYTAHFVLRLPAPTRWLDLPTLLTASLVVVPTAMGFSRSIGAANRAQEVRCAAATRAAAERAFDAGRVAVIDLVGQAHLEAVEQLARSAPGTDPVLVAVAGERLKEVGRRLENLSRAGVSPSSTTTT